MRVLITGGTGFIGRTLTPLLLDTHHDVTLLVREAYGMGTPLPPPLDALRPRLTLAFADLRNFQLTARAVRAAAPEAVIHLAAAGVSAPFLPLETALRHNLTGTLNLLRAACDGQPGVQQVIIGRTPGEHSAMNVYAASKAAAWQFARMYSRTQGWPIVGALVFQAYGPWQAPTALVPSALRAALAGADFPMTTGTQQRDWIYVDDVAAGLLALLGQPLPPGTTVDLGTGTLTAVAAVAQQVFDLVGGAGKPLVGALPGRPGEEGGQSADTDATHRHIGWRATVPLTDGLRRTLAHARAHPPTIGPQ